MDQPYGGLHPDNRYQVLVVTVGNKLITKSIAKEIPYKYDFHLLADKNIINAFALPEGQIFISKALFSRLENKDQLAGILGYKIGHILGKHSNEHITSANLCKVLVKESSAINIGAVTQRLGQGRLLKNGRGNELESDEFGVLFMLKTGSNPEEMIGDMEILKASARPNRVLEFQSSNPEPENRIEKIREAIRKYKSAS
jgi:predicted Zn-dependent protease